MKVRTNWPKLHFTWYLAPQSFLACGFKQTVIYFHYTSGHIYIVLLQSLSMSLHNHCNNLYSNFQLSHLSWNGCCCNNQDGYDENVFQINDTGTDPIEPWNLMNGRQRNILAKASVSPLASHLVYYRCAHCDCVTQFARTSPSRQRRVKGSSGIRQQQQQPFGQPSFLPSFLEGASSFLYVCTSIRGNNLFGLWSVVAPLNLL